MHRRPVSQRSDLTWRELSDLGCNWHPGKSVIDIANNRACLVKMEVAMFEGRNVTERVTRQVLPQNTRLCEYVYFDQTIFDLRETQCNSTATFLQLSSSGAWS